MSPPTICSYSDDLWPNLCEYITKYWGPDHPLLDKSIYEWQYQGFGNYSKDVKSLVLLDDNDIVGFIGIIPGLYQVPNKEKMSIINGGSPTMWFVDSPYRGKWSFKMFSEMQKNINIQTICGINPETALPIYKKLQNKYSFSDEHFYRRYIIPLDSKPYYDLIKKTMSLSIINDLETKVSNYAEIEPSEPNVSNLETVWKQHSFSIPLFSLYRNAEFWKWRYFSSPSFQYLYFKDDENSLQIIARIETITNADKDLNNSFVFRICEIIPNDSLVWNRGYNEDICKSLLSILSWAKQQNCVLADYYQCNDRFDYILKRIGFIHQRIIIDDNKRTINGLNKVPLLFNPLRYSGILPLNLVYRLGNSNNIPKINDVYSVKTESDMDRPYTLSD